MGPRAERDPLAVHTGGRISRPAVSDLMTQMPDGVIVRTRLPARCRLAERSCVESDVSRVSSRRIIGRRILHFVRTGKDRLHEAELKPSACAAALEERFRLSLPGIPDSGDTAADWPIARATGLLAI